MMQRLPDANSIVKMWLLKKGHLPMHIRTDPTINEIRLSWFAMDEWWPFCWVVDGKFYLGDNNGWLILTPPENPDFFTVLEKHYNLKKEIARAAHFIKINQPNLLIKRKGNAHTIDTLRGFIL